MNEQRKYVPDNAEDWRPEPKPHYSDKGSHKARHDFWHAVDRVENAVISARPLPSPTENDLLLGILKPRMLKRGGGRAE